jgi:hypothetical protein
VDHPDDIISKQLPSIGHYYQITQRIYPEVGHIEVCKIHSNCVNDVDCQRAGW